MPGRRSVVDHSLRRRALLADVRAGRVGLHEVCDATPYLVQAARHHGETTGAPCPVCARTLLISVSYVFGEGLGTVSGQAKTGRELSRMDAMQDEFAVYRVEVCRACGWNHLLESYLLGTELLPGQEPRAARRRSVGR